MKFKLAFFGIESKKTTMSAAEWKIQSCEKILNVMSKEEKQNFKEKERAGVRKAMQNKHTKKWEQMTPDKLQNF